MTTDWQVSKTLLYREISTTRSNTQNKYIETLIAPTYSLRYKKLKSLGFSIKTLDYMRRCLMIFIPDSDRKSVV